MLRCREDLLRALFFQPSSGSEFGAYILRFCVPPEMENAKFDLIGARNTFQNQKRNLQLTRWVYVLVDEFLPIDAGSGALLFASCR